MELTQAVKDTYCRKGSKKARRLPEKEAAASARRTPAHMASRGEKRLAQRLLNQPPPKLVAA